MNEFESSAEETNIAETLERALSEFECGRAEPGLVLVKGDNGEDYVSTAMIGRGMTTPTVLFPWSDPFPFILRPEDIKPNYPHALRREEEIFRHIRITIKVKRGPGKGRYRSYWSQKSSKYVAYYGKKISSNPIEGK